MKIQYRILSWIFGLALFVSVFLIVIDGVAFDQSFYKKEFTRLNHAVEMKMSNEDLEKVTLQLFDYIHGSTDSLDVIVMVDQKEVEMFNEKEKLHMIDVRDLYLDAMKVRTGLLVLTGVISAFFIYKMRKKGVFILTQGIIDVAQGLFIILAILCVYALLDFNDFWLKFHYLFFTNDLFLLDPSVDRLIQLVPGEFFFNLVIKIGIIYIVSCLTIVVSSILIRRKVR